ncbi:hypothetical protein QTI33_06435 [Variovorax sp. J22P271]|uniref:hypothetical protein n=1 Tax=Variovorax davisae TaxID=3053515 RepID=UPI0025784D25|nr:hypothetical protein [Variovorax sp. J22P271]MDM0031781.1 hypothetical protein [Variovorax sp. J22P271]
MANAHGVRIENLKQAVIGVIGELTATRPLDEGHSRPIGFASDSPAAAAQRLREFDLDQRSQAGLHLSLAAAAAALEVAAALMNDPADLDAEHRERALRRCAMGAALTGEVASRAVSVLADDRHADRYQLSPNLPSTFTTRSHCLDD